MYLNLKESKMQKIQYELYGTSVLNPMEQSKQKAKHYLSNYYSFCCLGESSRPYR